MIILDENAAAFVGSWSVWGSLGYGGDFAYRTTSPGDKATYAFVGLAAGTYDVYATWVEYTNRSTAVPIRINGGTPINVNQQLAPTADAVDGGRPFKKLGTVAITGSTITVEIGHAAGIVVADAVGIVFLAPPPSNTITILYAGDSNLEGDPAIPSHHVHGFVTEAVQQNRPVTEIVTAAGTQAVVNGPLAVGGAQYQQIVAQTGVNVVLLSCGAQDVLNGVAKAAYKSALRATVDGIGAALGCPVILCEIAEYGLTPSTSLADVRAATAEVAAESSHVAGLVPMADAHHAIGEPFDGIHYRTAITLRNEFVRRCFEAIVNAKYDTAGTDWAKFDQGTALLAQFKTEQS